MEVGQVASHENVAESTSSRNDRHVAQRGVGVRAPERVDVIIEVLHVRVECEHGRAVRRRLRDDESHL